MGLFFAGEAVCSFNLFYLIFSFFESFITSMLTEKIQTSIPIGDKEFQLADIHKCSFYWHFLFLLTITLFRGFSKRLSQVNRQTMAYAPPNDALDKQAFESSSVSFSIILGSPSELFVSGFDLSVLDGL